MIKSSDLDRLHDAAKMIEYDGVEAYYTCVERYGEDIANALIIAFLRRAEGGGEDYPEREGLREKVNVGLKARGLVKDFCPTCGQEVCNGFF